MYGSSLMRVTLRPRDSRIAAREAEAIPLPREDTTPPVTKTNLVMSGSESSRFRGGGKAKLYGTGSGPRCSATLRPMNDLAGKHIVLGLTGGIACYKSAELCRLLVKEGATVQVVMTEAAAQFITPVTMQALSNRRVYSSHWDARDPNNMPHINLAREADAILIAPCSADIMARLMKGRADELLSLLCLARPIAQVPLL